MQYKTIIQEMLEFRTEIKNQFSSDQNPLETLDRLAMELKSLHEMYQGQLAQKRADSHPIQISSEALEMAFQELENRLLPASRTDEHEVFSLDGAMAFLRRYSRKK